MKPPSQEFFAPLIPSVAHYLVPTNFGRTSRAAWHAASGWATTSGARVTLLHVAPWVESLQGLEAMALLHHAANRPVRCDHGDWHHLHRSAEGRETVGVRTEWRKGKLVDEVVRFVEEEAVGAVVLGARRWWFPWEIKLEQRLARRVNCQVVTVHESLARTVSSPSPFAVAPKNAPC